MAAAIPSQEKRAVQHSVGSARGKKEKNKAPPLFKGGVLIQGDLTSFSVAKGRML